MGIRVTAAVILLMTAPMPARGAVPGEPPQLTKSFSPTTIGDGGVSVLTFTFTTPAFLGNTTSSFVDTLPSSLRVANTTVGGTCANAAAATVVAAGGTTVTVTNIQVPGSGASCTLTVNVTNVPGQLNASCGLNPAAFTNSSTNISGNIGLDSSTVTPSCLVVTSAVPALPRWMLALLAIALIAAAGMAAARENASSRRATR